MDRREFSFLVCFAGISGLIPISAFGQSSKLSNLYDLLLETIYIDGEDQNPRLRNAEAVGNPRSSTLRNLKTIYTSATDIWGMQDSSSSFDDSLESVVAEKCLTTPSYLTEYIEASVLFQKCATEIGDAQTAARLLILGKFDRPDIQFTKIGRARKYVTSEFIAYAVRSGGYKTFGFKNYRGHIQDYSIHESYHEGNLPYTVYKKVGSD